MAHAVARHSSEKLSLGIFLTVASQLAFQVFQVYVRNKQGPTQGRGPGGGAQGIPVAWYILVPLLYSTVHSHHLVSAVFSLRVMPVFPLWCVSELCWLCTLPHPKGLEQYPTRLFCVFVLFCCISGVPGYSCTMAYIRSTPKDDPLVEDDSVLQ